MSKEREERKIRSCPHCGKEMEAGYLQISHLATFNRQRHTLLRDFTKQDEIVLTGDGILSNHGGSFYAWVCEECGVMLIDYENNRAGMGKAPIEVIADKVDGFFEKIDKLTEKKPDVPTEPEQPVTDGKKRTLTAAGIVEEAEEKRGNKDV